MDDTGIPVLRQPVSCDDGDVPVLKESARASGVAVPADELALVQAELTALTRELTDRLLDGAMRDVEAALFEKVSNRLRDEMPELIERVLRDHLKSID